MRNAYALALWLHMLFVALKPRSPSQINRETAKSRNFDTKTHSIFLNFHFFGYFKNFAHLSKILRRFRWCKLESVLSSVSGAMAENVVFRNLYKEFKKTMETKASVARRSYEIFVRVCETSFSDFGENGVSALIVFDCCYFFKRVSISAVVLSFLDAHPFLCNDVAVSHYVV